MRRGFPRTADLNAAVAALAETLLGSASVKEISRAVLEHALRLTRSETGYIGSIDTQTGKVAIAAGDWRRSEEAPVGNIRVAARVGEVVIGEIGLAGAHDGYGAAARVAVERLASLYALALQRRRIEARVLALKDCDESLLDLYPDGVAVIADGKIVHANPAFLDLVGRSAEDVHGRMAYEVVAPEEREPVLRRLATLRGGSRQHPSEYTILRPDGSTLAAETVSSVIAWEGRPAFLSVFRDMSRRKIAEDALRRRQAVLQSLARFDEVVSHLSSSRIVTGAMEFMRSAVRADRATISLFQPGGQTLRVVEVEGVEIPDLRRGETIPVKATLARRAARTGRPVYRPELGARRPVSELEKTLLKAGLRSAFVVPLLSEGIFTGTVNVCSRQAHGIAEDDRNLLRLLGPRMALALKNSLLHEELQESERRYRSIFNSVPVSIWEEDFSELLAALEEVRAGGVRDWRGFMEDHPEFLFQAAKMIRVRDVNDYTLRLYGARDREELLGSLDRVFVEESYPIFAREVVTLAEGHRSLEFEGVNRSLSGERIDVMVRIEFPPDAKDFHAVTVSVTDITRRKRAETALREARDGLERRVLERTADLERAKRELESDIEAREQAEQERDRLERELRQSRVLEAVGLLAGGVAHDFNNILGSVIGCLYVAKLRAGDDLALIEELDRAQALCKRGGELTRQLLTVARRRAGTVEVVPLGALLEEVRLLLDRTVPKTIEVRVSTATDAPHVWADRSLLTTALLNLSINARDAMPRGGRLTLSAEREEDENGSLWAAIRVTDTGVGMAEAHQERIFDPFFTTKPPGEGSGMGLAMVHAMVTEWQGTVSVKSRPGEGSTFTVRLPADGRDFKPDRSVRIDAVPHPLTSAHLLIVEDEESVARLMVMTLEACGYSTLHASGGLAALEAMRDRGGDVGLVILDLLLPDLGGEDVFRLLRGLVPEVPVLLVSGREDLARSLDPQVPVLPKPFTAAEFLAAVSGALSRAGATRRA